MIERPRMSAPILPPDTPAPCRPPCDCLQDEAAAAPNLKLLEMAHTWKRQKMGGGDAEGGGGGGSETGAAAQAEAGPAAAAGQAEEEAAAAE